MQASTINSPIQCSEHKVNHPVIQQIIEVFQRRGAENYGSEAVSQQQHAIQTALLAKRDGAGKSLIVAALLHDIGHILENIPLPKHTAQSFDDKHETRAYFWLLEHFGHRVADPVRLHVAAKRYLCTVDPSYCEKLSPTSRKSFFDQGGNLSPEEKTAFERENHYFEALQLRRWDDEAKDPTISTPGIEEFIEPLQFALSGK